MSKKIKKVEPVKWERVFESEDIISTWKYDSKISKINPYQVDIKYKSNPSPVTEKKKSGKK
jgi:hypothetical protein